MYKSVKIAMYTIFIPNRNLVNTLSVQIKCYSVWINMQNTKKYHIEEFYKFSCLLQGLPVWELILVYRPKKNL